MKYKYIYFMLIYTYYPHICIYIYVHQFKNTYNFMFTFYIILFSCYDKSFVIKRVDIIQKLSNDVWTKVRSLDYSLQRRVIIQQMKTVAQSLVS